jgi:hypothetical protein
MHSDIILTLKTLFYSGDRKNYTFDKYCTAHVEQHNRLNALLEFGVQGLDEAMKIHYFKEGIKDIEVPCTIYCLDTLHTTPTALLTIEKILRPSCAVGTLRELCESFDKFLQGNFDFRHNMGVLVRPVLAAYENHFSLFFFFFLSRRM